MLKDNRVCDRCNRSQGGHRHQDIGPWMLCKDPAWAGIPPEGLQLPHMLASASAGAAAMTPEELDRIETEWCCEQCDGLLVRPLAAALREAWTERDRALEQCFDCGEHYGVGYVYGEHDGRIAEREECAKLVDAMASVFDAYELGRRKEREECLYALSEELHNLSHGQTQNHANGLYGLYGEGLTRGIEILRARSQKDEP